MALQPAEPAPAMASDGVSRRCHQRGVLGQAGATYQFRHLELQRRLATRP